MSQAITMIHKDFQHSASQETCQKLQESWFYVLVSEVSPFPSLWFSANTQISP